MNISEKVIIRKIFVTRTTGLIGTKININIIKKRVSSCWIYDITISKDKTH